MKNSKPCTARHFYFILTLVISLAFLLAFPHKAKAVTEEEPGALAIPTFSITLHAGEYGYFGEPGVKEKESIQYLGESFVDDTVPDTDDPTAIFLGWSTEEDADFPNVKSGTISAESVGTDLYAVWTKVCYVTYHSMDGYFETEEGLTEEFTIEYEPNSIFEILYPEPYSEQLVFDGWYTSPDGNGELYTEETVITQASVNVYAKWVVNTDIIPYMELDTDYHVDLDSGAFIYSFTPDETTVYEIKTFNTVATVQSYIRLMDKERNRIEDGNPVGELDVALSCELTEGETYYFAISSFTASMITCDVRIAKTDIAVVEFYTNLDQGEACFDGDPEKLVQTVRVKKGAELHGYNRTGLEILDTDRYIFSYWSVDPESEGVDRVYAEDGMKLYAIYLQSDYITLNAGEGYFVGEDNQKTKNVKYGKNAVFHLDEDPVIDDPDRKFAGWATEPGMEEPDITPLTVAFEELPAEIYAVYSEKVLITFDANGGYFFDPAVTVTHTTAGKGRIFYDTYVMNADNTLEKMCWKDQDGEDIQLFENVSENPFYKIKGDSTFTVVWGKRIVINGNGGYFLWDRDNVSMGVRLRTDRPFSGKDILDLELFPIIDDHLYYFAGWATDPELTEPDVIDGETAVTDLDIIYAVWKEDTYSVDKGEGASWEKGSEGGLDFTVKRAGDDTETYRTFSGIKVDGADVSYEAPGSTDESPVSNYNATDKNDESLYLTLNPVYLETLEPGSHELTFVFNNNVSREVTVTAGFTVKGAACVHEYGADGFCVNCGEFIFTDVTGSTSQKRVSWAYQNSIVKGTGANSFSPAASCSRIQFVMMLWKMNGSPKMSGENPFSDISGKSTVNAILWALDKGIINTGKTFNPGGDISRSQIVMILWKLSGSPKAEVTENPFADVSGSKLTKAVLWAYGSGVVKGTSDTTFSPEAPCTRLQLVTMLYKYSN